jgi:predicted site-specific integrase-resolvase
MTLIEEAAGNGCRRATACAELDISLRTYQRWTREGATGMEDGRKGARLQRLPTSLAKKNARAS